MFIINELLIELFESQKPSEFLTYLRHENIIGRIPELNALIGCIQEPLWHPEGDVWTHTLLVVDVAAELRNYFTDITEKHAFMLGALCHDFGKPYTNNYDNGKIRSLMHDQYGFLPASKFLSRFDLPSAVCDKAHLYISKHLVPMQLYKNRGQVSLSAIRRLQSKIHIPDLVQLTRADHWGRTDEDSINRVCRSADWLLERYKEACGM